MSRKEEKARMVEESMAAAEQQATACQAAAEACDKARGIAEEGAKQRAALKKKMKEDKAVVADLKDQIAKVKFPTPNSSPNKIYTKVPQCTKSQLHTFTFPKNPVMCRRLGQGLCCSSDCLVRVDARKHGFVSQWVLLALPTPA